MPQVPIIVPVIITGLVVGGMMKSSSRRISKRRLVSTSLLSGILNVAYVYLFDLLFPSQSSFSQSFSQTSQFAQASQFSTTSGLAFIASCFLAGFLMVLAVLGIAMAYARRGRGQEIEEIPELPSEEKPEPTSG